MLVGRDPERHRLDTLLAAARLGRSGVVVVSGEAGIGKTALLQDVCSRAEGLRLLAVTGTEAERDLPFAGLAQLLRLSPPDLDRLPTPQADALGAALALRPGPAADRFAVGAGLLTLLAELSETVPLCLVVDDAHQFDPASQDALLFVARRLLADPIALIIAVRDGEPCRLADPGLPRIRLTGLDPVAAGVLARSVGDRLSSTLVEHVLELSRGNPLAIRELAADPAARSFDPLELPTSLPDSLIRTYARRVDDLSLDGALAARCAAVVGGELVVVTRACGELGVPVDALAEAEAAGLLHVDGDRVRFRHPLVRSALYATADSSLRRRLHSAAAGALADGDDRRVWHQSLAVIGPDEPTAAELEKLADRATHRTAYAVAATAAERAAVLSPAVGQRARRLLVAGTWAWRGGEPDRAQQLLRAAADGADHDAVRHRADHLLGIIAARSGEVDRARDILLGAAAAAADPVDALASLAEAVNTCFYLGDTAAAVRAADAIQRLLPTAPADARARGSIAAGCARILAGQDGSGLIRQGLRALPGDRAGADPGLAAWSVLGPLFLRDAHTGRDLMTQVVGAGRARSAVGELPHLLFHLARDEATSDRWDRAEGDYGEAVVLARELGQSTELTASLAGLAWLEARQGRADASERHAAEALQLADRHHIHAMEIWAQLAGADLALSVGEVDTALERYVAVQQRLDDLGLGDVDLSPAPEIVECLLRAGRHAEGAGPAAAYADRATAKGQPWALARAARVSALDADGATVDDAYAAALAQHDRTLDLFERARTLLAYGSRLRRLRRRVEARPVLQEAIDAFVRIGARPWAGTAADELAATGATVRRPGDSPVSRLTPRELQIAVLLAEGRTTREAAGALFLSPKTVEYHLRNVYVKLDISSRSALAARLRRGTTSAGGGEPGGVPSPKGRPPS